ncbi:MAG: phage holin family protein [Deltaproteobacteria bacterium]|nr:phage holin family protein [Deltaproteobacteria bacterium]MBW2151730.1 phage holin family protein [Deltaproteobacteria bacterium]
MAELSFVESISRLKRRFFIRRVCFTLFISGAVFLLAYTIGVGFERSGLFEFKRSVPIYGVYFGISIAAAVLYSVISRKKSFARFLIDMDARLNLKDTISTAYEYYRKEKTSALGSLLLADASLKLSRLNRKQLFPSRHPVIYALVGSLLLINALLLSMDRLSVASRQPVSMVESLRSRFTFFQDSPSSPKTASQNTSYQKLKTIAKKLNEPSSTRKEILTALNELLEEVQNHKSLLSKQTRSSPGGETLKGLSYRTYPVYDESSLSRLKELFQAMFSDEIPEKIQKDSVLLAEYLRLETFLKQVEDSIKGTDSQREPMEYTNRVTPGREQGRKNNPDRNRGNSKRGAEATASGREEERPADFSANAKYPGQDQSGAGDAEDYMNEDEDISLLPGSSKSKGQKKSPYEIQRRKGPVIQDKVMPAEKEDFTVYIRALTGIGKAKVKQKDIARRYQREVESILKKEEIPLNYREFIKNYFLSIGLGKEP